MISVTFITTCLVSIAAIVVWRFHPLIVVVVFIIIGLLDTVFLTAVYTKVPTGAWFTLMIAFALSFILFLWRYGKGQQWKAEAIDNISPGRLVYSDSNGDLKLNTAFGERDLSLIKGIYH